MHERARSRLPPESTPIREAELMRALVFDFPVACGCEEFAARVRYVSDVWCSTSKVRDIELNHGVSVSVSGAVTRLEMQGLVCAFVEFICRNTHVVRGIAAACADRVLCWYPALVCTESVESVRRGERMLHALERASGTRDFLVLAVGDDAPRRAVTRVRKAQPTCVNVTAVGDDAPRRAAARAR
jgi:hypothetical protein